LIAAGRFFAKARRWEAVATSKRLGKVGRLPVADQTSNIPYRDRSLLNQQLSSRRHPPREQILLEGALAELRIRAL
jgi:hypothetical protein